MKNTVTNFVKNTPSAMGGNNDFSMLQPDRKSKYHECIIEVVGITPGSLTSFLYAYCRTIGAPENVEPYMLRKAVSFVKLARYVRTNITNDFDGWYRKNESSATLCEVLAKIINTEENRTEAYSFPDSERQLRSQPFYFSGGGMQYVLVAPKKFQ